MSRVYSQRFLTGRALNISQEYRVPVGYRAVVRFVSFNFFAGVHNYATFRVAGTAVVYLDTPGPLTSRVFDGRWVAYGGEILNIVMATADSAWHVSGFIFQDLTGPLPGLVEREHLPQLAPLPSSEEQLRIE